METLVVMNHLRNQEFGRNGPARFGSFGSPPSAEFREINCRTFQSGAGILPTPLKSFTTPVAKRAFSASFSPKTPTTSVTASSEGVKNSKRSARSSAIAIPVTFKVDVDENKVFREELPFSELWAGPAYSNSPPPSSLPIPKFSVKPKRTVSLELPPSASLIDFCPHAKSAPASPTRDKDDSDSATKTLRRILNLDIADE